MRTKPEHQYGVSVFLGAGGLGAGGTGAGGEPGHLKHMREAGFTGVFTSLHIPEDDPHLYAGYLAGLGAATSALGMGLTVDISGNALDRAGFSLDNLGALLDLGVTRLRADFHISNQAIAAASRRIGMCLNASTVTEQDIAELDRHGADFANLIAWHNYYPRPETGISLKSLRRKNAFLRGAGFTVVAFTPGDTQLRGPVHAGLPTCEKHRHRNPLAGALELTGRGLVDEVYLGDTGLLPQSYQQFAHYLRHGEVLLFASPLGPMFDYVVEHQHVNRQDAARDVIRSADARFWEVPHIAPANTAPRPRGSVTIDNERYGRYQGDVQVTLRDLPADHRVNVVGRVRDYDLPLLPLIGDGVRYAVRPA